MNNKTILFALFIAFSSITKGQIVINEIASRGTLTDFYGEQSDWIELYNSGASPVNLFNYGLSDDVLNPLKWKFPAITIDPESYVLVLANGKNIVTNINHWETAVNNDDVWRYFVGASEPPSDWETPGFNDISWLIGDGGIGYGDGDDNTIIGATPSVYMRQSFNVTDITVLENAKLHADYDDAFVAYLNGVEIARSTNIFGTPPAYNTLASIDHEAALYAGYDPEVWEISAATINSLIVEGANYLCIQVHNAAYASSDLSSNFWLSFGINNASEYFDDVPVWFSGAVEYNQTNFKISNTGETIYLSDVTGIILDSKFTSDIALSQSNARVPDAGAWCITGEISPSLSNNGAFCYAGYEPDPGFSITSGFYTGIQVISLSSVSATSIIRYTTDGSAVTATSPIYSFPIIIDENTVISAKCFSSGTLLPGKMIKQTYFINEDEYTLPILSISIDPGSLFDYDTGIYELGCCYDGAYPYFGANFWQPWERFAHIEYFTEDGIPQWNKDMSLEIHGGWSRAEAQKGFRVDFKNQYDGELDYPLFGAKPEMGEINNFNLRNGGQHVWSYKFQDAFLAKVMKETHIDYEEWQPCMLFINGAPWGLYEIREKADEHFVESNYGIDNNNVDFLNAWGALNGSDTGFVNLYYQLMALDPASDLFYNKFETNVDVENYMDYYIGEIYYQNVDFGGYYWGVNNTKLWREQNGGKWRFLMYDTDAAMGFFGSVPSDNYIELTRNPSYPNAFSQIFDRVVDNIELRNYFVNRFADLINTIYKSEYMDPIMYSMRDSIATEIDHQVEVWGAPTIGTVDYYVDYVLDYNVTRRSTARTHINTSFSLAGQRSITLSVEPEGAGYIKINTIIPGVSPWTGIYFDGVPVTITAIANPGYTFSNWEANELIPLGSTDAILTINLDESEPFKAIFNGAAIIPELMVTEINYNSNNSIDAGDWVEIYNNGAIPIDLSEWNLMDRSDAYFYNIPFGTQINPGDYLVIAENIEKFNIIYPDITNVIGGFYFNFDNSGDAIKLFDLGNNEIFNVQYSDSLSWPKGADGTGRTLELTTPGADPNDPSNWFDGCLRGSPGTYYTPCENDIVFGEINYHSSAATDAGDWIELWNTTTFDIDISGWKFVDDEDTLLYTFLPGTILNANERFVVANDLTKFDDRHAFITNVTGPFLFGLDGGGEELRLIDNAGVIKFTMLYDDILPWPLEADGLGKTLELLDATGKMNEPDNWFAGCPEGSPANEYDPDCLVNINENNSNLNISIFPNPANESVFINIELNNQNTITLIYSDNSGIVLQKQEFNSSETIEIKRNNIASGIYWIKIISGDDVVVKKIVWM